MRTFFKSMLIFAFILCFAGCTDDKGKPETTTASEISEAQASSSNPEGKALFSLPFSVNDSLNPYTAKSKQNILLGSLIYEPLIRLSENFEPQYTLAKLITASDRKYTVILRNEAKFSDGSPVTALDVVYSFGLAKNSDKYKGVFSNVSNIRAFGGDVVITLAKNDPFFANLLDFPVIKNGSKDVKGENGRVISPIGSGRYVYVHENTKHLLKINQNYNGGKIPAIKTINLLDTPDNEALIHNIESGRVSVSYTDFSDNDLSRLKGKTAVVNLNSLVYIGVNASNKHLKNKEVRRAISFSLDRQRIVDKAYYQNALAANGIFNPKFKGFNISDDKFYSASAAKAVEELKTIGYNNNSGDGVMRKKDSELSINILVNSENSYRKETANILVSALHEIGIKSKITACGFDEYMSRIQHKDYDIYIGEVLIANNMDLSSLLDRTKVTANGTAYGSEVFASYKKLYEGEITDSVFKNIFESEMPFIPLAYRQGILSYSTLIGGTPAPTVSDIFMNIEDWTF